MTVLNDDWIIHEGPGIIKPFKEEQVNPASYDVTVGNHWIFPCRKNQEAIYEEITLYPGEVVLATTQEEVQMPFDVVADLKLKSSLGRLCLNHSLSGFIDPGFIGNITLELQNIGPNSRILKAGTRVAQLVFMQMNAPTRKPYGLKGHYQGQKGTTKSWTEDLFPKSE